MKLSVSHDAIDRYNKPVYRNSSRDTIPRDIFPRSRNHPTRVPGLNICRRSVFVRVRGVRPPLFALSPASDPEGRRAGETSSYRYSSPLIQLFLPFFASASTLSPLMARFFTLISLFLDLCFCISFCRSDLCCTMDRGT